MRDIISAEGITPFLSNHNPPEHIHVFGSLASTNKTAKEMIMVGIEHGTVIIADSQTAGKGRHGRAFHSPPGHGIYMSTILHSEQLWFKTPTLVTAFAAVSVCESIEAISDKNPQIKWVNDIYLNNRKICGILTESVMVSGTQWTIIGIGINFSTPSAEFPEELRNIAGSVFADGNPTVTRNRLIGEIMNRIISPDKRYSDKELLDVYKKRLMMLGRSITVMGGGTAYAATAVDIDDAGRLIVRSVDGKLRPLSAGEISISIFKNPPPRSY